MALTPDSTSISLSIDGQPYDKIIGCHWPEPPLPQNPYRYLWKNKTFTSRFKLARSQISLFVRVPSPRDATNADCSARRIISETIRPPPFTSYTMFLAKILPEFHIVLRAFTLRTRPWKKLFYVFIPVVRARAVSHIMIGHFDDRRVHRPDTGCYEIASRRYYSQGRI